MNGTNFPKTEELHVTGHNCRKTREPVTAGILKTFSSTDLQLQGTTGASMEISQRDSELTTVLQTARTCQRTDHTADTPSHSISIGGVLRSRTRKGTLSEIIETAEDLVPAGITDQDTRGTLSTKI
ncbi:hypothetical protein ACOMHN_033026 [Nucella lapillus]